MAKNRSSLWKKLSNGLLEDLFAENFECVVCGRERLYNNHNYLCDNCYSQIKFIQNPCKLCGDETLKEEICFACSNTQRYFDKVICTAKYSGVAKKMIHMLKYFGKTYLASIIANFMFLTYKERPFKESITKVLPVPLHRKRIVERGYNQADLLANEFCKLSSLPYQNNLALRIKETPTQTHLTGVEREKNMKGAFFIPDNINLKDEVVLIIDDVFTTGATINEFARVLKEKGAKKVYGLTFCHT